MVLAAMQVSQRCFVFCKNCLAISHFHYTQHHQLSAKIKTPHYLLGKIVGKFARFHLMFKVVSSAAVVGKVLKL